MPGAYDVPFDAGDEHSELYEAPASPGDSEAAALAELDGRALQQSMAAEAATEELLEPSLGYQTVHRDTPRFVSSLRHVDLTSTDSEAGPEGSPELAVSVIEESVRETVEAAGQWTFEKALECVADAVHPGAGRLVSLALTIKEVLGDAEALASPDSPRNLHVPLFQVTGGLTLDLNVHLRGGEESEDAAPLVSGFLSPGDGGLFGGWAMEVEQPAESGTEAPASDPDTPPAVVKQVARPGIEQGEWSWSQERLASPVIDDDLTLVKRRVEGSRRRAVVLREAAWRLRTQLHARPEFAAEPVLVIYDPLAGLVMWLVKPGLGDDLAGRHIVIQPDPITAVMTVFIR